MDGQQMMTLCARGKRVLQRLRLLASPILISACLSSCALGPDYIRHDAPVADAWRSLPASGVRQEGTHSETLASWWTVLGDPTLNDLVERALKNNRNVKQAIARVREARERRNIATAGLLPSVGASASYSHSHNEADPSFPALSTSFDSYGADVDASWEIDIFGGKRRARESATAQLQASTAQLQDVLLSLLGDVALAYTDVRTAQSRLTYAERNLETQANVYDFTAWRGVAGIVSNLDVAQAKTNLEQTRAAIPSLIASLEQSKNRLATLVGEQPGALESLLTERKPVPHVPSEIVTGVPADLLRRRPDIRIAERQLAAQTAQVGVAEAELLPSLSLTGSLSAQGTSFGDLKSNLFNASRFGAGLNIPLFRGGALVANVRAQKALVDEAVASYEGTVLAALEEVEDDLVAWRQEQDRNKSLAAAATAAREASDLSLLQYNAGVVDFQTVVVAQRSVLTIEDQLALSDGEITSNLIRLYKGLGGGWSAYAMATPAAVARD
jgi:NodT family efflux transporter outer membrane factor (OMF) lipoprotein